MFYLFNAKHSEHSRYLATDHEISNQDVTTGKNDEFVMEPYSTSKSGLTQNEIQAIADKISDKLIKIVEKQLK